MMIVMMIVMIVMMIVLSSLGGNRLVLFDPDWNPASDKQAAGIFYHIICHFITMVITLSTPIFRKDLA